ncbi:ATP-binding protein [Aliikangiella coralliicola]|uniref:ATP-binding protein n=1 Tax=Aliikangiella coralliicola TaxID=2592383 RepID=A0A545UBN9_9GAMM|nr:ATP-binding protein [Aliikangiella coralliicola]TQV86879.1 ATP-binding protein [Aliikangiella coralliicola]
MDNDTLNSLEAAYQQAPSAELAKILIIALIEKNEVDRVRLYLDSLPRPLDNQDALSIGEKLMAAKEFMLAENLFDRNQPEQAKLLIACLVALNKEDEAKQIYTELVKKSPELEDKELEQTFNLNENKSEKPKLRVVEKVEQSNVTDLRRYQDSVTTFKDVVGLEAIKKQINKKIILPFQKPSLFQRFKKKVGGGVLLYGPPGCGKTLLARATAGECSAAFYNIEISDVLDMYIGESEQKLHAIFEKARSESPSVLFFDELEALAGKREHTRNSSTSNIVSQFLSELDGFSQNNEGVLVLASTNVPWAIDSAFLRPGRFDRMFFVPPPDRVARQGILEHHMAERPAKGGIDYQSMAAKTGGFSGADLFNLVEMASDEAIDESIETGADVDIGFEHFKSALSECNPTTTEWLTTARNYARYANDGGRYNDVLNFLNKHGK